VERSTKLADRTKAAKLLAKWREEIERGEFARPGDPTFLSAALAYAKAGGEDRFLGRYIEDEDRWTGLIGHFRDTALVRIDQAAIDAAAQQLYPNATAATRNRQVHSVVSAILKRAGVDLKLKRPKGARGNRRKDWVTPEQAFRLFKSADAKDREFGIFLRLLCYTGMRLGEALSLTVDRVELDEEFAFLPETKNGHPRAVFLPPVVVAALANHPRGLDRKGQRVFKLRKCGRLYTWLDEVKAATGPDVAFVTFHTFRHTWATWMRRYAGLDTRGLVGTGAWRDEASASRYEHVVVSEESRKAMFLPTENAKATRAKSVDSPRKGVKKQGVA